MATVARKPVHRGEREVSRKTIAQGRPDASAEPVCSCAFFFVHFAHETAGAARTRSSLRPLISEGGTITQDSGASRRGIDRSCVEQEAVIASEAKQSISPRNAQ
jgi:hypothetical protein